MHVQKTLYSLQETRNLVKLSTIFFNFCKNVNHILLFVVSFFKSLYSFKDNQKFNIMNNCP